MNGELAALYQGGKQIGGLYDWEIRILTLPTMKNGWYDYKIIKNITAKSYWLMLAPNSSNFEVNFYKAIQDQLVLIDAGKVVIDFPDLSLDRRLYAPIDIRWIGIE